MDLTSTKGFFNSVRNPSKNSKQPLTPASSYLPPSSSGSQKKFAPPPMRRLTSDSSSTSTPVPPPPPARKKEEPAGEWAEVLYDFTGEDLDVEESQRILIVERSSDDWYVLDHRCLALLTCCEGGRLRWTENGAPSQLPMSRFCKGSRDNLFALSSAPERATLMPLGSSISSFSRALPTGVAQLCSPVIE